MSEAIIIYNAEQIQGIRQSSRLAAQCLRFIEPYVVPGVSTLEINDLCDAFIRDHGAIPACLGYQGFPKSICISPNEVICHGIPGAYVLKSGDIVNIDITTILNGFFGDTSTMFAVGEISVEAQKLLEVTKEAMMAGINAVRPHAHLSNIGFNITEIAHANNYSVVSKYCGHGCGTAFHLEPQVQHYQTKKGKGPQLKSGMVFTIEPMLCIGSPQEIVAEDGWTARTADGSLSAQFEHTCLVIPEGVEILTLC